MRVSATLNLDQVYVADEVRVLAHPAGPKRSRQDESDGRHGSDQGRVPEAARIEITGVVTAIDGRKVSMVGRTFTLTPRTKLEGELTVGAQVEARLLASPNGELSALHVEVVADNGPANPTPETATRESSTAGGVRITGTMSAIEGNLWTVDCQRIKMADEAVILGIAETGAKVSPKARRQPGRSFLVASGRIEAGSRDEMATVVPTRPVPTLVSPTAAAPTAEPSDSDDGEGPSDDHQQTPEMRTVMPEPETQY